MGAPGGAPLKRNDEHVRTKTRASQSSARRCQPTPKPEPSPILHKQTQRAWAASPASSETRKGAAILESGGGADPRSARNALVPPPQIPGNDTRKQAQDQSNQPLHLKLHNQTQTTQKRNWLRFAKRKNPPRLQPANRNSHKQTHRHPTPRAPGIS